MIELFFVTYNTQYVSTGDNSIDSTLTICELNGNPLFQMHCGWKRQCIHFTLLFSGSHRRPFCLSTHSNIYDSHSLPCAMLIKSQINARHFYPARPLHLYYSTFIWHIASQMTRVPNYFHHGEKSILFISCVFSQLIASHAIDKQRSIVSIFHGFPHNNVAATGKLFKDSSQF